MKNNRKKLISVFVALAILISSVLAFVYAFADDSVVINDVNFPDTNFRDAVALFYDENDDGELSEEERNATVMIVSGLIETLAESKGIDEELLEIHSLVGIEYFENLTTLRCNNVGDLGTLDVSALEHLETLYCSNDGLYELNVSSNENLTHLHCCSNEFTTLDFSNNKNLTWLHCYSNLDLEELNLTSLDKLEELRCDGCNLSSLDLTTNTSLSVLNCSHNRLSSLDLSNNPYISGINDYSIGYQNIDLELVYRDDYIKAFIDLDENRVARTSYDRESSSYSNGAFFTDDYNNVKDGFSYYYSVGANDAADMKVSVSVTHEEDFGLYSFDTDNNTAVIKCKICGDEHIAPAVITDEYSPAGCVTNGTITYYASAEYGGETYTKTEVIKVEDALGHSYSPRVLPQSCDEQGRVQYTCSQCGDTYYEPYAPALGHLWVYNGTQTAQGLYFHCNYCNKTTETPIPASRLLDFWANGIYAGYAPVRTIVNDSSYVDVNGDGIINGRDYAKIKILIDNEEKMN